VKTYFGQRGRDRVLHLWVQHYGHRSPMSSDDVAGRILVDVFGPRLIEDDYRCYQEFRDDFMAAHLAESEFTLTDAEVRGWRENYVAKVNRRRNGASDAVDEHAESEAAAPSDEDKQHVLVSWGSGITRARLLRGTSSVLLLEGHQPSGGIPVPGAPLRVGLPGTPRMLPARLAAHIRGDMFLVSLGSRAVRGAARARVDLPAIVRAPSLTGALNARVVDISSSGARLRGCSLPVGREFELTFVPPGRTDVVSVRCVAVRQIGSAEGPDVGSAFCGGALAFRIDSAAPSVQTTN
jgi:hypothetical protein